MRQDHNRVLAHIGINITEAGINMGRPWLDKIRKTKREITQSDDDIRTDLSIKHAAMMLYIYICILPKVVVTLATL